MKNATTFALCAAVAAVSLVAGCSMQGAKADATPVGKGDGQYLLMMTVDFGPDDDPTEFAVDGKLRAGECVEAMRKLQAKTTLQRVHQTVTITEVFSCVTSIEDRK